MAQCTTEEIFFKNTGFLASWGYHRPINPEHHTQVPEMNHDHEESGYCFRELEYFSEAHTSFQVQSKLITV